MSLPALYHAHHQAYTEDLPFWLAQAQTGPGACLELGCGTGRVLIPLAESGITMTGLDHDAGMLAFLRTRLSPALLASVELIQADLTDFTLAKRFATILLPCNTYSTLTIAQRVSTLQRVHAHLQPGGRFVTSLPNPAVLLDIDASAEAEVEDTFIHPESGLPVQVSSAWDRQERTFTLYWFYDQLRPDGQITRNTARVCHHLATLSEYQAEFQAAGLQVLARYGDFDGRAYHADAAHLILVVHKPSDR
ncbi:MAG: methyltransferase domain-containing protein [Anaerolineales bacterium]|nr:methyltransferase domain-containing protein [Anaerolineales bacterium]